MRWLAVIPPNKWPKWEAFIRMEAGVSEEKALLRLNKICLRFIEKKQEVGVKDIASVINWKEQQVSRRLFRLKEICMHFLNYLMLTTKDQNVLASRVLMEYLLDEEQHFLVQQILPDIKKQLEDSESINVWTNFQLCFFEMQLNPLSPELLGEQAEVAIHKLQNVYQYHHYRLLFTISILKSVYGININIQPWLEILDAMAENQSDSEWYVGHAKEVLSLLNEEISPDKIDAYLNRIRKNPHQDILFQKEALNALCQICGLKFQKGQIEFAKAEIRIRRFMEDLGILLHRGQMITSVYRRLCSMALASGDTEEARRITETYAKFLPPDTDKDFPNWNRCDIAFHEGDFKKAGNYMLKIPMPNSDFEYAKISILKTKIYWELREIEAGLNGVKTYRNWVNKKSGRKLPTGSIERYKAFLKVMYQGFRKELESPYKNADWEAVHMMIEETNPLEKAWLNQSFGTRFARV